MGPPREHGGMQKPNGSAGKLRHLQWGRRVNTAECRDKGEFDKNKGDLQWGRRVNTAEWLSRVSPGQVTALLQWGRRVNTAECRTRRSVAPAPRAFNGAAA